MKIFVMRGVKDGKYADLAIHAGTPGAARRIARALGWKVGTGDTREVQKKEVHYYDHEISLEEKRKYAHSSAIHRMPDGESHGCQGRPRHGAFGGVCPYWARHRVKVGGKWRYYCNLHVPGGVEE